VSCYSLNLVPGKRDLVVIQIFISFLCTVRVFVAVLKAHTRICGGGGGGFIAPTLPVFAFAAAETILSLPIIF